MGPMWVRNTLKFLGSNAAGTVDLLGVSLGFRVEGFWEAMKERETKPKRLLRECGSGNGKGNGK